MLKVVIDTNQFISSVIVKHGLPRKLIDTWKDRGFILLTTPDIIEEIGRAFRYPRIKKKYKISEKEITDLLELIEKEAVVLSATRKIRIVKDDPDDNKFIACAFDGSADFIVSGDPHLLKIQKYNNIPIVTVREFFEQLK